MISSQSYFTRMANRNHLVFPDGTPVQSLRVAQLYAALEKHKVPRIRADMGKDQLIDCYELHMLEKMAEANPTGTARSHPKDFARLLKQLGEKAMAVPK